MPAIAAVAIPAAAAVVGGIIQHKTAGNAAKRQQQSTDAALTYQKGRDTLNDQRYMDVWKDYQARHAAWEQRNFGAKTGGAPATAAVPSGGPVELAGSLGGMSGPSALGAPPEGTTVADLGPWNDWRRYGVN